MANRVVKNKAMKIEFGDYGNYATLTPIAIEDRHNNTIVVTMLYDDGRQIGLCFNYNEVDQESFN